MTRQRRAPGGVVELLRLLVIAFCAGIGFHLSRFTPAHALLGPINGVTLGVILGSGLGYVLGGMLGRSTLAALDRTEATLREVSAESLVAGAAGLIIGLLVGAAVGWPILLITERLIGVPLFLFVLSALGLAGARLGANRSEGVVSIFGAHAGMAPRRTPLVALPRLVDTSIAIDGRIIDVVRAGFLHGIMLVPTFVLDELRGLADAADPQRRAKGRRGLDALEVLRREQGVRVEVLDEDVAEVPEVDGKLVRLAVERGYALLTVDTNLARAASIAGVRVLNLHALALAVRPPVTAGDEVPVLLIKPGREPGQAVGYLDDGTMVVVERARGAIGAELAVRVTSVLTTASGRMVFATPALPGPRTAERPATVRRS